MKHPNFKNGQKAVFPFVFFLFTTQRLLTSSEIDKAQNYFIVANATSDQPLKKCESPTLEIVAYVSFSQNNNALISYFYH